jgi:hypothetical protein
MGSRVLRYLLWRLFGLLALLACFALVTWFLHGGPGRQLRGSAHGAPHLSLAGAAQAPMRAVQAAWEWAPLPGISPAKLLTASSLLGLALVLVTRWTARHRRRYTRLRVETYRTDQVSAEAVERLFDTVQFLDSPSAERADGEEDDPLDGGADRELAGVGAEGGELAF